MTKKCDKCGEAYTPDNPVHMCFGPRSSKDRVLPKTDLEWIAYALNDAATALPVLFTMLTKIGARDGAMVADEILGHVKSAQKNCSHLIERERTANEPLSEGMDTPWPLRDVLAKLIEATEHLLDDHACDTHGHEEYRAAVNAGKKLAEQRASQPPSAVPKFKVGDSVRISRYIGIDRPETDVPRTVLEIKPAAPEYVLTVPGGGRAIEAEQALVPALTK